MMCAVHRCDIAECRLRANTSDLPVACQARDASMDDVQAWRHAEHQRLEVGLPVVMHGVYD